MKPIPLLACLVLTLGCGDAPEPPRRDDRSTSKQSLAHPPRGDAFLIEVGYWTEQVNKLTERESGARARQLVEKAESQLVASGSDVGFRMIVRNVGNDDGTRIQFERLQVDCVPELDLLIDGGSQANSIGASRASSFAAPLVPGNALILRGTVEKAELIIGDDPKKSKVSTVRIHLKSARLEPVSAETEPPVRRPLSKIKMH